MLGFIRNSIAQEERLPRFKTAEETDASHELFPYVFGVCGNPVSP